MAFRRDEPSDDFRRQVSALRSQLGQTDEGADDAQMTPAPTPATNVSGASGAPESTSVPTTPAVTRRAPRTATTAHVASVDDAAPGIISAGMRISGSISSSGPIHIFGSIDGDVTSDTDITVAEGADAQATLSAPRVTVAGNVTGRISSSDLLEVLPRGSVSGDVDTAVIIVHDGARLNGNLSMRAALDAESQVDTDAADADDVDTEGADADGK